MLLDSDKIDEETCDIACLREKHSFGPISPRRPKLITSNDLRKVIFYFFFLLSKFHLFCRHLVDLCYPLNQFIQKSGVNGDRAVLLVDLDAV